MGGLFFQKEVDYGKKLYQGPNTVRIYQAIK